MGPNDRTVDSQGLGVWGGSEEGLMEHDMSGRQRWTQQQSFSGGSVIFDMSIGILFVPRFIPLALQFSAQFVQALVLL